MLWTLLASSAAILLFIAATGFTTQRYEVDFVPLAALAGLAGLGIHIGRSSGGRRTALQAALGASILGGAIANLALGIAGPYDEMVKSHPGRYVRIAQWFSPVEQFRPILKPKLDVVFTAEFSSQPDGFREPLMTIGSQPYRHFIY